MFSLDTQICVRHLQIFETLSCRRETWPIHCLVKFANSTGIANAAVQPWKE